MDLHRFDAASQALITKAEETGGNVIDLAGVLFFDHDLSQRAVVASCCGDLYQVKRRLQLMKSGSNSGRISDAIGPPLNDLLANALPAIPSTPEKKLTVEDLLRFVVTHPSLEKEIFAKAGVTWPLLLDSLPRARLQSERYEKIERLSAAEPLLNDDAAVMDQGVSGRNGKSMLKKYGIEMVANAATLDPVIGREELLDRVVNILSRKNKRNPCLVGHPGVGKTALVEGVAKRIAEGRVPAPLQGCKIWCISLGSLVSGSKLRGQFEEKVERMLNELKADPKAILFFDEIHLAIGAGRAEGSVMDVANLLKPSLARGDLRCIGATTYKEFKEHVQNDGAFARRFVLVDVPEPSAEESLQMLKGLCPHYESFHKVRISNEVLSSAVELGVKEGAKYGRFLPDCAIDLLDEACVRCIADGRQEVQTRDIQVNQVSSLLAKL